MAWSVDRLGRSLQDLVAFLTEIHALKGDLYLHQQGLDTTTPGGKAMFQMLGVFAEFERSIIQERILAGLRRARKTGTKSGKPFGRPTIGLTAKRHDPGLEGRIRDSLASGMSYRETARACGVALGTVQRVVASTRPFDGEPVAA